ncbi:MAG: LacI family DNA-binding transcriptional regulator [Phycisphaeraceae bacterium]
MSRTAGQRTKLRKGGRSRGLGRVTLADVARAAGVHSTTVSAVLNQRDHCYASAETRQRIVAAAERLGYRPSALARGLSGQRTATIGMVTTGYDVELVTRMMFGVESMASRAGLFVLSAATYNDAELEDQVIQQLIDRGVDGIVIWPCMSGEHRELRRLAERGFPIVTFGHAGRLNFPTDAVYDDAAEAGRLQAQHLIACGCERIWLITFSERCDVNDRKIAGFEQAMAEAGRDVRQFVVEDPKFSWYAHDRSEFEQLRDLFRDHADELDALACPGDMVAQVAVRIATEMGLRVPDDVAIIGNGGMSGSADGALPLSTIGFDAEGVGRTAFELLEEQLDGKRGQDDPCRTIVIQPELIPRASTVGYRQRA